MKRHLRRDAWTGAASVLVSAMLRRGGIRAEARQGVQGQQRAAGPQAPKITLKAQPLIAMAPARVVLTAELVGGDERLRRLLLPGRRVGMGRRHQSESSTDCPPYEPGKSEIKRRFTVEHVFRRPDMYRVTFHLKRRDKSVGAATVNVQVRPGLRDGDQ